MKKLTIPTIAAIVIFSAILATPLHAPVVTVHATPKQSTLPPARRGLRQFLSKIAYFESENNPSAVNKYGMLGKYQFHPNTIRVLGYDITDDEFLSDAELQDRVMVSYLRANRKDLRKILAKYTGRQFKGIRISESGVLAAAHFAGSKNVARFFENPTDATGTTDANGASIRLYLVKFANYEIGEI